MMNGYWWESKAFWSIHLLRKYSLEYAIAITSITIGCAGLSLVIIWLSGIYFQIIQRSKSVLSCLLLLGFSVLITGKYLSKIGRTIIDLSSYHVACASLVVWILIIVEAARLSRRFDREIFHWPMWLAVGSTGGYLISLLFILVSVCHTVRHRRIIKSHYYQHGDHF